MLRHNPNDTMQEMMCECVLDSLTRGDWRSIDTLNTNLFYDPYSTISLKNKKDFNGASLT